MQRTSIAGILVTLLIHGGLAGGVVAFAGWGDDSGSDRPKLAMVTIEASLAYKSKEPTRQPQKERKRRKKKAPIQGVSRDEDKQVTPKKEEEKEEDFAAQFEKFRQQRQGDEDRLDEEEDTPGDEAVRPGGQFDGSEHGFADVSRGDPYMQQLAADVYSRWELPTLEKGEGDAVGCVRLAADGSIMETKLEQDTKNTNIDLSVQMALEALKKMRKPGAKPVPSHLLAATQRWTCFKFPVTARK